MTFFKDNENITEAYLSVTGKTPKVPGDEPIAPGTEPNDTVSVGPMEPTSRETLANAIPPTPTAGVMTPDNRLDIGDEEEEDSLTIENLNSIRESIAKVACYCACGNHLEPWQQNKLAIAMDNLAEIARKVCVDVPKKTTV